jgi:autotransporter-associated beta strand protein
VPIFPIGLTFAGTTRLANNNDLGNVTTTSLTFDAAAGAFVLGGNGITNGSGGLMFNGNPATPVTQTINLNLALSASQTIDTPINGNLSVGGDISSTNDLYKIDAGTLTMAGTNTIESLGVDGGTNIITGSTTLNGTNWAGNYDRTYVGEGEHIANCTGTLVIQPGAALTVTGFFNDAFVIGRDGGSGALVQNGGSFTYNPINQANLLVGASSSAATRAEYDMNNGVLDLTGHVFGLGLGSVLITGVVNQVSGIITNVGNLSLGALSAQGYGVYNLSGGSIYLGTNISTLAGGITTISGKYAINLGGGTVGAVANWSSSLKMNLTGSNGPVTFNPNGNTILLSGILSGGGGLTVNGAGVLEMSGANTYTGDTTVSAGSTLQLDVTGSSVGAFRVANGGLLNLNYSGNYVVGSFYVNGVAMSIGTYNSGNLPSTIIGSGNLQVVSGVSTGLWTGLGTDNNWSTAGNWNNNAVPIFPIGLNFAGTKRLVNNNDLSSITASSVTFDSAAGAFVLGGNDITLAGSIGFDGNPAAPVTQTVNLNMAWLADQTIDTPTNGNLSLGGNIASANALTKIDGGTLTLGGYDGFSSYYLNGGTNVITGTTTINGIGSGSRFYVGNASTNYNGTIVIPPGAALNVTGTFGDALVIGRNGGSGRVIQNGGTFSYNCNESFLYVGATSETGTTAEYDMNGGLLDLNGNSLGIALGDGGITDTGVVNQTSGLINNVGGLQVGSLRAYGYGVYTLSGGSIYIGYNGITTSSGKYALNLGGGTVGAQANWSSSLNMNLTNLNGSVTFDTAGNTISLSGTLYGTGGLIVSNSGTLDLSGANVYTGDTVVNAGSTLELDSSWSDPTTFRLSNGSMLNLTYTGTYTILGCYTNGVALLPGTYNAANLGAFIEGSGNLVVATVVIPQTVAYTANVNTTYGGASTGNTLNMGQIFAVNGAGIEVFQLGFFDYQNHPLAGAHTVTLFSNETAIASVTIPAGSAANLIEGYAFEPLSMPVYLPAGSYTVLAYGVDGSDPYGEGSQGNVGFNGSADLSAVNTCFDFTTQGSPDYPGGIGDAPYNGNWSVTWGDPSADASFTYINVTAAPTPPVVNHPVISGGNLILLGSGGTAGAGYTWLTSTNLAAPIASWTTNTTGIFDGSGDFSNAIPFTASVPAMFFQLRTP